MFLFTEDENEELEQTRQQTAKEEEEQSYGSF